MSTHPTHTPELQIISSVDVEYIESGAFQGDEEDVFHAQIASGECYKVVRKSDLEDLLDIRLKSSRWNDVLAGLNPDAVKDLVTTLERAEEFAQEANGHCYSKQDAERIGSLAADLLPTITAALVKLRAK